MKLIIYSKSEQGFWRNELGWVQHASLASVFTKTQAKKVNLPISKGSDAIWIKYNEKFLFDECVEGLILELDDEEAIKAAKDQYHRDGECEVDDNAQTSRGGDHGCYVQAWVWVYWPEAEVEEVNI